MLDSWGLTAALCLTGLLFPICGTLHTEGGAPSSLALYQDPPANYKEPGTPRLNSIIVKSKPYSVNDSLQLLHQALDGKTWRREVPVTVMTSTTNMDDTTAVTTQATTSGQELATIQQYLVDCSEDKTCTETTTQGPTFRPYSQEELDKFLQKASATGVQQTSPRTGDKDTFLEETDQPTNKLANLYIEDEAVNVLETTPEPGGPSGHDKSKSWNLVSSQTHKHPYDDRNGWVSLEPIPWSLSQIQKWEPNPHTRPQIPSWSSSSPSSSSSYQHSPGWSSSSSRPPQAEYGKPSWVKPTYDYRPQESYHKPSSWSQASPKPTQHGPPPGWGGGGASGDIITDGHPGYFPSEKPGYQEQGSSASFQRPQVIYKDQYNGQQSNSPTNDGDGRWVLLSSTKGYSFPQRQRSTGRRALRLEAPDENGGGATFQSVPLKPALKSRRTVRLTVLPPLEGSVNTTISHGGLLEVEETGETVEEAHRAYAARMLRLQTQEAGGHSSHTKEPEQVKPKPEKRQTHNTTSSQRNMRAERRLGTTMRVVPVSRVQPPSNSRSNAVLAAVGAGMIPATVAMLLPMVLGRKRRKRETHYEPVPLTVVETPHRRRRKPVKKIIVRKKPTEVVYY